MTFSGWFGGQPALALLSSTLLLAACTPLEEEFAGYCRGHGFQDGTIEMTRCVEGERLAYQADIARMERMEPRTSYAPPSLSTRFKGGGGCYPSPGTGITC
jgi:hypothetical protein